MMTFIELFEKTKTKIEFKKLAPNGHVFLISVMVPQKVAEKLIKNTKKEKSGYYEFQVTPNNVVIVGYNLWSDLNLDKYI